MRIELRDEHRRRVGRIVVDPVQRPTRVSVAENVRRPGRHDASPATPADAAGANQLPESAASRNGAANHKEAFLHWDTALDDAGQLRRCVACGCTDLFRDKAFPQVTGFVVVMAFAGAAVGALGLATNLPVLLVLVGVLLLDVAILVFAKRRLVCYRCRTTFHELPIARYHRAWDRGVADRYPVPAPDDPSVQPAPVAQVTPEPVDSPEEKGYFV